MFRGGSNRISTTDVFSPLPSVRPSVRSRSITPRPSLSSIAGIVSDDTVAIAAAVGDKNPTAVIVTVNGKSQKVAGVFQRQAKKVAELCAGRPDLTGIALSKLSVVHKSLRQAKAAAKSAE